MRAVMIALILGAVAFGVAGCGGGSSSENSSSGRSSSGSGSGKTEVELDDYYFQPKTISGAAGKQITLELKNEGNTEHNFSLDDQSISKDVEAGEEAEVTVTVPQSGKLTFYCKDHRSKGMTGTLEVGSGSSSSGY
jgi:plastocyanin